MFEGFLCHGIPILFGLYVFVDDTHLAVEQTNAPTDRYGLTSRGVVAANQIRSLTAGDFHAVIHHIFLPCLLTVALGKNDFSFSRNPRMCAVFTDCLLIKDILAPEPCFINQIVLCVAHP